MDGAKLRLEALELTVLINTLIKLIQTWVQKDPPQPSQVNHRVIQASKQPQKQWKIGCENRKSYISI